MPKPIPPSISSLLRYGLPKTPLRSSAHLRINALRPPHPRLHSKRTITTTTSPNPKSQSQSPSSFSLWTLLRSLPYPLLLPLLPIALVLAELTPYEIVAVNGPSMTPCLNSTYHTHSQVARDHVLVKRFFPSAGGGGGLKRGMVVIFRSPRDPARVAVKRVVAVGGDRVRSREGGGDGAGVVVPWNHVWVEGDADDSRVSMDSNVYGCISANLVSGVVVAVVKPWDRARWVSWEEWEGGEDGERQRGRVEKEAVRVYEPVTF